MGQNERQLNGGQQGSGSGLDADSVDGKNAVDLGNDLTFVENFMNDAAAFHERSSLEQSLNAWNMDDGFIDILWDETKISSKNSVTITQGSNNSGDGRIKAAVDYNSVINTFTDNYSTSTVSGTVNLPGRTIVNYTAENYSNYDRDYTATVHKNGQQVDSLSYSILANSTETVSVGVEYKEGDTYTIDHTATSNESDIVAVYSEEHGYYQNASVTHIRKDLGFTPSKLVPELEYDASGAGEGVDIDVADNSGNTVNITEADFETEVLVSFADGNIQVTDNLSGDGSSTPEINQVKLLGVQ